jgi:CRISPR/Cas system CSM-associated protein Csm2 small subunit
MAVYRAPTGNFNLLLNRLDDIIKTLNIVDLQPIICGDINIDYLTDIDKKRQLDAVLLTYNLSAIVYFPTRSQAYSKTAIDNIFIDTYKFINFTVSPLHNGLSDHDARVLKINNVNLQLQKHHIYTIRNINNYSTEEFKTRLSYESWNSNFSCNGNVDTDTLFNLLHNNYLRIFYASFSSRKIIVRSNNNSWLTPGIRISCKRKRCLYLLTKDRDDVNLKNYYRQYCKTLTSVIKEAKNICIITELLTLPIK